MLQAVGVNHFSKKTIKALKVKGIEVTGITALPDEKGSFLNSETGYLLNDNGTCQVRTFSQVLKLAE